MGTEATGRWGRGREVDIGKNMDTVGHRRESNGHGKEMDTGAHRRERNEE